MLVSAFPPPPPPLLLHAPNVMNIKGKKEKENERGGEISSERDHSRDRCHLSNGEREGEREREDNEERKKVMKCAFDNFLYKVHLNDLLFTIVGTEIVEERREK